MFCGWPCFLPLRTWPNRIGKGHHKMGAGQGRAQSVDLGVAENWKPTIGNLIHFECLSFSPINFGFPFNIQVPHCTKAKLYCWFLGDDIWWMPRFSCDSNHPFFRNADSRKVWNQDVSSMVVLLFHNHSIKSPVYPKKHIHQGFLYPYLSFNVNPPYSSGIPINIYIYKRP